MWLEFEFRLYDAKTCVPYHHIYNLSYCCSNKGPKKKLVNTEVVEGAVRLSTKRGL